MADKINKYLDTIDELRDQIDTDSEEILSKIDVDEMIANPVEYLKALGRLFFEAHTDELEESIKAGEKKAKAVLVEIN